MVFQMLRAKTSHGPKDGGTQFCPELLPCLQGAIGEILLQSVEPVFVPGPMNPFMIGPAQIA